MKTFKIKCIRISGASIGGLRSFLFQSNEASVLDSCCTYFLYLSIGLHVGNCQNCWESYVSYLSMTEPHQK
jgi:hypothetical protein